MSVELTIPRIEVVPLHVELFESGRNEILKNNAQLIRDSQARRAVWDSIRKDFGQEHLEAAVATLDNNSKLNPILVAKRCKVLAEMIADGHL